MINVMLVSYDDEQDILLVGKKRLNESVEIVNAMAGEEAKELYSKLMTVKERSEDNG